MPNSLNAFSVISVAIVKPTGPGILVVMKISLRCTELLLRAQSTSGCVP